MVSQICEFNSLSVKMKDVLINEHCMTAYVISKVVSPCRARGSAPDDPRSDDPPDDASDETNAHHAPNAASSIR